MQESSNIKKYLADFFSLHKISDADKSKVAFCDFSEYENFKKQDDVFYIFEDWRIRKPEIIKSKITAIYGKSKRIFARLCEVRKIDKISTNNFLNENHIYGSTVSKSQLGLFFNNELVAVASFASQRKFASGKSAEMLRFCSKNFTTITGGLSKLLKFYQKNYNPHDIMTYIDLDWGRGYAFKNMGFEEISRKSGYVFYCNKITGERIPEKYFTDVENVDNYAVIRNSGSIKFVKVS